MSSNLTAGAPPIQVQASRLSRLVSSNPGSSATVLTIRLTSMALNLLVQVVMARVMGLAAFGIANTALAFMNILVIPAAIGYDVAAIRFVALERGDQMRLRALTVHFARAVGLGSLVVTALVAVGALVERSAGNAGLAIGLGMLIIITPTFAFVRIGEAWLRGFGSVVRAQINSGVVIPVLSILFLVAQIPFAGSHHTLGVAGGMGARAVSTIIAGGIIIIYIRRRLGGGVYPHSELDRLTIEDMHKAALVLCGVGLLSMIIGQIDIVAVSYIRGASAAGVYSAASRIATSMNLSIIAVAFVLAPHAAKLFAEGKTDQLQNEVSSATSWSVRVMLGACAVIIPTSPFVLGIFGSRFGVGADSLRILMLGQAANAACGPVAMILSMTGKQKLAIRALSMAVLVDIVALATLVPMFGIVGAAWATTICTVIWNVAMIIFARRDLGIWVLPRFAVRMMS